MKVILSIQRYNMTHNLKDIRSIFTILSKENDENEYVNVELRERSSIVDIKIQCKTLMFFSKICNALLQSRVKDAKILYNLLLNVFKAKKEERFSDDRKKASYKLFVQDNSFVSKWDLKPVELSIYRVLKALDAGRIYTMEINRKSPSAIGVVGINEVTREFYIENTYKHHKCEMETTDFIDLESAVLILLMHNADIDFEDEEVFIDVKEDRYYISFTSCVD